MSTETLPTAEVAADAPEAQADGVRTYRGETIEELLPRIRAELGPDAVILARREGLAGGVGGFFQRRCVEVDARAGAPRVDTYDEPPPVRNDAATREGLATDGVRKLVDQAQPFAALLDELAPGAGPAPAPPSASGDDLPAPSVTSRTEYVRDVTLTDPGGPRRAATLRERLVGAGLGDDLAAEIIDAAVASRLPFGTEGRLRTMVRDELAARLPVAPAAAPGPRALAVVGPAGSGKTAAVAALAAAHMAAGGQGAARARAAAEGRTAGGDGAVPRQGTSAAPEVVALTLAPVDGGAALHAHLAGTGVEPVVLDRAAPDPELAERLSNAFVVVDTPPAWAGSPDLEKLARRLRKLGVGEVHLALRADSGRQAARELIDGLARLRPSRLLATGAGATAHLGGIADAALRSGLPLGYVADGPGALAPADARALAARIVA